MANFLRQNWLLDRRHVLKGLGVSLALPLLDGMRPLLAADKPNRPKRSVFIYLPNGGEAKVSGLNGTAEPKILAARSVDHRAGVARKFFAQVGGRVRFFDWSETVCPLSSDAARPSPGMGLAKRWTREGRCLFTKNRPLRERGFLSSTDRSCSPRTARCGRSYRISGSPRS